MSSREASEQAMAEYALLARLAEEARRRIELINANINDTVNALRAIEEIESAQGDVSLLVPLGGGVLARVLVTDKEKMLVSVGANVVVEKAVSDARRMLEEREKSLRETLERQLSEYQAIAARLSELETRIEAGKEE